MNKLQKIKLKIQTLSLTIVFLLPLNLFAQIIYDHHNQILDFRSDSLGTIYFKDKLQDFYVFSEQQAYKAVWSNKSLNFVRSPDNNILLIDKDDKLYKLNSDSLECIYKSENIDAKTFLTQEAIISVLPQKITIHSNGNTQNCKNPYPIILDSCLSIHKVSNKFYAVSSLGLTEMCLDDLSYTISAGFKIKAATSLDPLTLIIGTEQNGLKIFYNDQYKNIHDPALNFLKNIKDVKYEDGTLWILNQENTLFRYDWENQILDIIGNNIVSFDSDNWDCVYFLKGSSIGKNIQHVNQAPPFLEIENVRLGYTDVEDFSNLNFNVDQNDLAFKIKCNYAPSLQAVAYQYRSNADENWKTNYEDWIYLSDLSPGDYTFEVRPIQNSKYPNFKRSVKFKINEQSGIGFWLYPFIFLLLLFLICLWALRNTIRDKNSYKRKIEKSKLKQELSKTQQNFGKLRLNPHFLNNALNSIAGLIALGENSLARQSLNKFSHLMRMVLDLSEDDYISIDEEKNFLGHYLSLEQLIRNNSFTYKIDIDSEIHRIPPMLIQPFLENAIIHGLASKAKNGIILLSIKHFNHNWMKVVVEDNGIGRAAATLKRKKDHESKGIRIIKDRLNQLDRFSNKEKITYTDLFDDKNKPSGTKVTIMIPK